MKNKLAVLALVVSVAAFGTMMRLKTDVQQMSTQRLKLAREQLALRETKRVLEAEYALLVNPIRLAELAKVRGFVELGMLQLVALPTDASLTAPTVLMVSDAVVVSPALAGAAVKVNVED